MKQSWTSYLDNSPGNGGPRSSDEHLMIQHVQLPFSHIRHPWKQDGTPCCIS
uniref:Uncharacterized protein n=1 Tax=Arundo donax TaxID=35708 RepID=A0A0A9GBH9_ARUDO